ncbi:hypothetical protein ABZ752_13980 [Streptomyces roseifaciens]
MLTSFNDDAALLDAVIGRGRGYDAAVGDADQRSGHRSARCNAEQFADGRPA